MDKSRLIPVISITALGLFIVLALIEGLYPKIIHAINRDLWEQSKPEKYYVKIHAFTSFGCSWTWESVVQGKVSTLISEYKLHSDEKESFCAELEWFIVGNKISIDHIFDVLEQTCVSRGFLDCGSTFDAQYRYPLRSESYETYIIEVEQFIDCDSKHTSCP